MTSDEARADLFRGTATFASDQEARCRFCKRYVVDGLYTRVSFPDGIANVCDICREKADEDTAEWRDTEVEVVD